MNNNDKNTLAQKTLPWLVLAAFSGVALLFLIGILYGINPLYIPLYQANFVVIIGLPLAALAALLLVLFLRQTQGPIEFEGLGFSFKGASGPVILWILCYLAFVLSFKLLWIAPRADSAPIQHQSSIATMNH